MFRKCMSHIRSVRLPRSLGQGADEPVASPWASPSLVHTHRPPQPERLVQSSRFWVRRLSQSRGVRRCAPGGIRRGLEHSPVSGLRAEPRGHPEGGGHASCQMPHRARATDTCLVHNVTSPQLRPLRHLGLGGRSDRPPVTRPVSSRAANSPTARPRRGAQIVPACPPRPRDSDR